MRDRINKAVTAAMKAGDKAAVSTLRLIKARIQEVDVAAELAGKPKITDPEIIEQLAKMIKQRRESIAMYEKGGRPELKAIEVAEIAVIEGYLPRQLSESEVGAAIAAAIAETGAAGVKDMGKIMSILKSRYAGQMDFGRASGMLKTKLG